ncbi:MAG: glycosyltransferase family 4 protein [Pirellulaceae bacterium]
MRRLKILTWHVHGNYLWYLSRTGHDFYLPVKRDGEPGYGGRGDTFPFGDHVHDIPAEEVRGRRFDLILYQHRDNYVVDREMLLSAEQQRLPRIFVQHDPPLDHPTDQRHWFADPDGLLVHVTPFNALMWDSGRTPTRIIDHGVPDRDGLRYTGELARGIVVINNLGTRGRRLGPDIFLEARRHVPLDLVGMESESLGGLGEVKPPQLADFERAYRFFFNPIRYTSLGLAVCEAMMLGMPVVGLATTEMATAIQDGVTGFVDTSLERLIPRMQLLLHDPAEARRLGDNAREYARDRFGWDRFVADWNDAFASVTGTLVRPRTLERKCHVAAHSVD